MATGRLQILGTFALQTPGRDDASPGPRKARALLGYLALNPAGATRSRLASLLWGDAPDAGARTSLRQALSAVRRGLGPDAATWLETDGDRVSLATESLQVDALEILGADPQADLATLQRVTSLYRGPLLEGLCAEEAAFEHWRRGEQERIRESMERLTHAAVERAREGEDEALALRLSLALVNLDWTRESAHRLVMEGYARTGQLATARAHFQRFREQLAANLQTQPSAATLEVYRNLESLSRGGTTSPTETPASEPGGSEPEPEPVSQRRQISAWFARAADSTDPSPESQHASLALLWEAARSAAAAHGADACRREPDGLLALFGTRASRGDEAERAVRAALDLKARLTQNRVSQGASVGVASGLVVPAPELAPPWIGSPLAHAKRLAARAEPGEFELCPETRDSLRSDARQVPLIGRELEMAQLQALLSRASKSGRGGCVVLRGQAGIGKTRLCEAACDVAGGLGITTLRLHVSSFGEGDHRDLGSALGRRLCEVLSPGDDGDSALAQVLGESRETAVRVLLGLPLDEATQVTQRDSAPGWRDQQRREVLVELLQAAAQRSPLLCVIEDVHWASTAQLQEVTDVLDAARTAAVVCVLTVRTEDEPDNRAWRAAMSRPGLTTVEVAPLDPDAAVELAGRFGDLLPETARLLADRAGGNPLFLEQLARRSSDDSDSSDIPATVQSLVIGRLDRQTPKLREAVELASVVGQRMRPDTLAALICDECSLQLREEGWVRQDGRDVCFVHALVRDAAYSTLHRDRRAELHRRVAAHYAPTDRARQAEHLAAAGDPESGPTYLAAAREALDKPDVRGALDLAERGIEASPGADRSARYALSMLAGSLRHRLGDSDGALAHYKTARTLGQTPHEELEVLLGEADVLNLRDEADAAFERLDQAARILDADPDDLLMARVATLRGNFHFPRGEYAVCAAAQGQALILARRAGNPPAEARALSGLADAEYTRGNVNRAAQLFSEVIALADREGLAAAEIGARGMRGLIGVFLLALDDSRRDLDQSLERAKALGEARASFVIHGGRSLLALMRGEADDALEEGRLALSMATQLGARRFEPPATVFLARAHLQRGERETAYDLLTEARERGRGVSESFWLPACLGTAALAAPDAATRRARLEEGRSSLGPRSPLHTHAGFYAPAIQAAAMDGHWDLVDGLATDYGQYTRENGYGEADIVIARARLLAAQARGEAADTQEFRRRTEAIGIRDPLLTLS